MLEIDPLDLLQTPEEWLRSVALDHIVSRRDQENGNANQVDSVDNRPLPRFFPVRSYGEKRAC